jgi:sugar phosphate isomerase/epimerase
MDGFAVEKLVASPCCNPEMGLEEVLAAYSGLGFRKFEVFTSWAKSAFDIDADPAAYRALGERYGLRFTSFHLPAVGDDQAETPARAVQAARFAAALGVGVVLFKATSRPNYIRAARPFLDAIAEPGITPVLQNHAGAAISTLEDFREVLGGIGDPRMKALLEVGHFHKAGVPWQAGCDLLGDRIALVHIKDMIGGQSVPFGTGEIDLPALFRHLRAMGYDGDYVVEMEVADREHTLRYLQQALRYLQERCDIR